MNRASNAIVACLLFSAATVLPQAGLCQAPPAPQADVKAADAKPFYASWVDVFESPNVPQMSEQRKSLEQTINRLQAQIESDSRIAASLRTRASSKRQFGEFQLIDVEQQLKANKEPVRQKILEGRRADLALQVETAKTELIKADQLDALIEDNRSRVNVSKAKVFEIERAIDEAINIHLRILGYRVWLSAMFAVLILILMWRFFAVTLSDPAVRQAVFSAQSGIQFLTLFCLVIAIFVFGIAGILEGKELSALLGGLSGYILGRVTQSGAAPPAPAKSLADLAAQAKG